MYQASIFSPFSMYEACLLFLPNILIHFSPTARFVWAHVIVARHLISVYVAQDARLYDSNLYLYTFCSMRNHTIAIGSCIIAILNVYKNTSQRMLDNTLPLGSCCFRLFNLMGPCSFCPSQSLGSPPKYICNHLAACGAIQYK